MAPEPTNLEPGHEPGSQPQKTSPQDPPTPITQEQLDKTVTDLKQEHQEQLNLIKEDDNKRTADLIQSLNQKNTPPVQPTVTTSREEAAKHLQDEGDPSKLFDYFDGQMSNLKKSHQEEIQNIKQIGGSQISALAIQQAQNDPSMPYWKDYEKDILSAINNSGNSDPQMIREAYKYIVGSNHEKIMATEKEKFLRQAVEEGTLMPGNGKNGRGEPVEEGPKPEEIYSERAQSLLEKKGINADQLAQKLGKVMPFTDYTKNESTGDIRKSKALRYQEGFKDQVSGKEENAKLEEEFRWM